MFDGIKHKTGNFFLEKEHQQQGRKSKLVKLKQATKVGILYDGDQVEVHNQIKKYIRKLKEEEGIRKITALGYSTLKEAPDHLQAKLDFEFFTKKEVNWYGRPSGARVQNFLAETFDILLDFSEQKELALQFVLVNSPAKFKVGRFTERADAPYDLMINTGETQSLSHLIAQTHHYLKVFNNGTTA